VAVRVDVAGFPPQYARHMEPATTITPGPAATLVPSDDTLADEVLVTDELLVEEISIDGMCGVY